MNRVGGTDVTNKSEVFEETLDQPRAARPVDRPGDRPEGLDHAADGVGVWSVADVSAYLQIPVSSIYKMTARKAVIRIPHIRIGHKLRFRQADIDRWLSLLTISNLTALEKLRRKVSQVTHGNHP